MKNTVKSMALLAITLVIVSCGSQQTSNQNQRSSGQGKGAPSFSKILEEMDTDGDGKISESEAKGPLKNDFSTIDSDSDGYITESEMENAPKPQRGGGGPR